MPAVEAYFFPVLQSDLNNIQTRCFDKLLDLNGSKCNVMTFCRVNPQYSTYTLSDGSLKRITLVNDLAFFWTQDYNLQITFRFDDVPYIIKTLFISLVRPILEYGSPFLLFAIRGLNWDANLILPSYSSR